VTPEELRERIGRGESPRLDFKRALGNSSELAKDLVCFANSSGGQILIGIEDDGVITGVPDPDPVMLKVDDVAFNLCQPPVTVLPEVVDFEGKQVVVVNVPKGDQRPTNDGRYYVRSGTRCRSASREELLRLFQRSKALFYDEQSMPQLGLSDMDLDAVRRHLETTDQQDLGDDLPRLLKAWGLFDGEHPTVGGMVVFGRNPQAVLNSSHVVVGALDGPDIGGDFIDRKDLTGDLFEIVEQIDRFLRLYLRTGHEIVDFEPEKREEIPFAALREAVVNALVHRDYTVQGPVRIFVLSNRVEIRSPGSPPNSVDADAMRAGIHVPRNPHIYSRVAAAQLATRAGTGIARISRLLRQHSGQRLGIQVSEAQVVLILPRPAT
jgi:ATP-dependent DNA helicase RecG